jgi:hypothetical protein
VKKPVSTFAFQMQPAALHRGAGALRRGVAQFLGEVVRLLTQVDPQLESAWFHYSTREPEM